MAKETTRAFPTKTSFQENPHTVPSQEKITVANQENNHVNVDDGKRQKMESLLKRMSERCLFAFIGQIDLIMCFVQVSQSDPPQN